MTSVANSAAREIREAEREKKTHEIWMITEKDADNISTEINRNKKIVIKKSSMVYQNFEEMLCTIGGDIRKCILWISEN